MTDAHLWVAARYYHVLTKGPPGVGYVVAATATLGAVMILWSLRDGEAGNLMFDGGSICEFTPLQFLVLPPSGVRLFMLTAPISPVWHRHCRLRTVRAAQYVRLATPLVLVARLQLIHLLRHRHIHQLCCAPTRPSWCQVPFRLAHPYSRTGIEPSHLQRRPYRCARLADRQVVGRARRR